MRRALIATALGITLCVYSARAEPQTPEWRRTDLLPPRQESVRGEGLVARFYYPAKGNPPWPAVILLGGSEEGLPSSKRRINSLVSSGYCVLATAYFKEEGLPDTLTSVPLEFYDKAKTWLAQNPNVAPGGIAVIGGSKGGELALLLASRDPDIRCVVGIVPASHVFQGIAPRFHTSSSWSYKGKDLPFVPYVFNAGLFKAVASGKFHDVYKEALRNAATAADAARIPVEKINGPVLLLSGKKDQMWPSTEMCNSIVKSLQGARFPRVCKHVAYDADHDVGALRESWIEITTFLRDHYVLEDRIEPSGATRESAQSGSH